MRIDKYLWCTRYYKTRSKAMEACKKGHITLNEAPAKPAREIKPGDNIGMRIGQVNYQMKVLDIPKSRVGAKLVDDYRKDTTPEEALAHRDMINLSKKQHRKKGMGRPTKKERRDIEGFFDDVS